ncbi:MAG TPA: GNAT family N-acetyltransferase, partial [Micromonosporaceae bacterium]|nr:GNAT family N-acetyltransferase [Micromonosporaceae bacterium]
MTSGAKSSSTGVVGAAPGVGEPLPTGAVSVDALAADAFAADALTADGGIVTLRSVTASDADGLTDLYQRSSAEALRLRFLSPPSSHVIAEEVSRLVRPPGRDHDVVVAEEGGRIIGVASFEREASRPTVAEFAVFVDDAHHGRGIGTLLLEHLSARARARGITELVGDVLPTNAGMIKVAQQLTARPAMKLDQGVVGVGLSTAVDQESLLIADARDRVAAQASLRPLLKPRSVAVVGAGRTPGGIGHATLQALISYGFTGKLYAVNPNATEILGVASFPKVSAIPEPVELIIVSVPAPSVAEVIADAGAAGTKAAVVLTSGFGETGDQQGQAELVRIARRHGMRLVGPNCLGVLNTDPEIRLAATFSPVLPPTGGLALASQSGAVGIAVLDYAARTEVGLSSFVSLGNKADVSGNDLLSYWFDDPATSAVALYLESFGNPRRFARIARALGRRKPV